MASLTEVYEGGNGAGLRRLYAGVALFGVGAALLVAGIAFAATEIGQLFGLGLFEARSVAGILGGVGLPALLLGTMTVLPRAQRHVRVGAFAGALLSLVGVWLFSTAYPVDWVGGSGNANMTLAVTVLYFAGAIGTAWCLFASVASFKARNDPGGTVKLEITKAGKTKVVEVSNDNLRGALGGIGLLGGTPDGNVETQTNQATSSDASSSGSSGRSSRSSRRSSGTSRSSSSTFGGATASVTDGGSASTDSIQTPSGSSTTGTTGTTGTSRPTEPTDDAEFIDEPSTPVGDQYCGNCSHFRYVRTDDGMVPYCGLHSEPMDDMDACDEWTPNT